MIPTNCSAIQVFTGKTKRDQCMLYSLNCSLQKPKSVVSESMNLFDNVFKPNFFQRIFRPLFSKPNQEVSTRAFTLQPWVLAFRFKTLTASLVPVMVATALCWSLNLFEAWWISVCALLCALCVQIATNLLNDAIDFKKGADTKNRLGPKRATQSGLLSQRQTLTMGVFFLLLACVFGWPLILRGGWPILALGLVSCFLAYGYTGGPFPLAYIGLGDLFVILFFGLFAVVGTAYLHCLEVTPSMTIAGLQVGFLSTILIAINNLRDSKTDKEVCKKTLAVRFGDKFARLEILILTLLVYTLNFYYLVFLSRTYVAITFLVFPFGVFIVNQVYRVQKRELNKILGLSSFHQLVFALLLCLGLVL